ncbi:PGF-CTERM sorting domain-containing protein, partial [Methanoregula sp.]
AGVTTTAPAVVTTAPVATTKPSPGFGALIALIGLGAVAFVVVRRH